MPLVLTNRLRVVISRVMRIEKLLENNKAWAGRMLENDPEYFSRLEHQQNPRYLWVGCSDSRVPANQITGLAPGEIFVHRNIANLMPHTDFNSLSVLQFALEKLKVEHVIVCGHYGCSGIKAAMESESAGFVDNWLRHIKDIQMVHRRAYECMHESQRDNCLTEWNVMHQVLHVAESSFVNQAWAAQQSVSIHGWVYSLQDGLIRDLDVTLRSPADVESLRANLLG